MSNADWFAKKLNPNAPREAVAPLPTLAQPQPAQYAPPSQPNYPPTQQTRAQAARCPGCSSENYGGPAGYQQRCYDCGYPIQQSGSGLGKGIISQGAKSAGPVTPALQVQAGTFNGTTPSIGADGGFIK